MFWLSWYQSLVLGDLLLPSFWETSKASVFSSLCVGYLWSRWPTSDQTTYGQQTIWWWSTILQRIFEDFSGFFLHRIRCCSPTSSSGIFDVFLSKVFISAVHLCGYFSKSDQTWTREHSFDLLQAKVLWSVIGSRCGAHDSCLLWISRSSGLFWGHFLLCVFPTTTVFF